MVDPVLTATLSGQRKILLSWTFGSNADFQVFWKSSSPPGQEYVLLATTNAFSYTTADLDPSKTYNFYVRANVGELYFYSNVVELFVSCGKGVILNPPPPPLPPQFPAIDIYACEYGGDIYKQTGGVGDFEPLGQASLAWFGMAAAPNGDVYATVNGGDIYKQSSGVGDFASCGAGSKSWDGITVAPNGDVYACEFNGDIYKRTGGVGTFDALSQTSRRWLGMAAAPNGDIYASVEDWGNFIYIKAAGSSDFVSLGQAEANRWEGMAAAPNGDIYCCITGVDIYKRAGGVGSFVGVGAGAFNWYFVTVASNGDVYGGTYLGDIYKQTGGVGYFVALGQSSRAWYGMAAK